MIFQLNVIKNNIQITPSITITMGLERNAINNKCIHVQIATSITIVMAHNQHHRHDHQLGHDILVTTLRQWYVAHTIPSVGPLPVQHIWCDIEATFVTQKSHPSRLITVLATPPPPSAGTRSRAFPIHLPHYPRRAVLMFSVCILAYIAPLSSSWLLFLASPFFWTLT